jgi:predicted tellurium resistance membrane protein TerC
VFSPELLIALLTLTTLEIVLGVDNLVFISIAVGRLPPEKRPLARKVGLAFACLTRIMLLLVLAHLVAMDDKNMPLFTLAGRIISMRDLILGLGGLFLVVKGIMEIVDAIKGGAKEVVANTTAATFYWVIAQIAVIDIVFSIDSVITAVGMVRNIPVMIGAILLAVGVMIFASNPVGEFIDNNPAIRMLALAFIVLIGIVLIGECCDVHIPRGYIYGAMLFSAVVEVLNLLEAKYKKK